MLHESGNYGKDSEAGLCADAFLKPDTIRFFKKAGS